MPVIAFLIYYESRSGWRCHIYPLFPVFVLMRAIYEGKVQSNVKYRNHAVVFNHIISSLI